MKLNEEATRSITNMRSVYEEYVDKKVPGMTSYRIWMNYFYCEWGDLDIFLEEMRSWEKDSKNIKDLKDFILFGKLIFLKSM